MATNPFKSLNEALKYHAETRPTSPAFSFIVENQKYETVTFKELYDRVILLASRLQQEVPVGERAILLYPPGLDYIVAFMACSFSGVIAVPAYIPTDFNKFSPLESIILKSKPKILLSTSNIYSKYSLAKGWVSATKIFGVKSKLSNLFASVQGSHIKWISTDNLNVSSISGYQAPKLEGDQVAFLQFTSGSTGQPKGVMVSHKNLVNNLELIKTAFKHSESSVGVNWLPPYHDMGLIGCILQPIYAGMHSYLMSPMTFLSDPINWIKIISDTKAYTCGGPNVAYHLCTKKMLSIKNPPELDLSNWKVAFVGAEPINRGILDKFSSVFGPYGFSKNSFFPCYGLAESTLMVSKTNVGDGLKILETSEIQATDKENNNSLPNVMVGSGNPAMPLKIVNKDTGKDCNENQVGEIWVSGDSVTQGYWNDKETTNNAITIETDGKNKTRWLRTGDLGFLNQEELFIVGRIKDLIIVNGVNHYPQDIEFTVGNAHNMIRFGNQGASSIKDDAGEKLIVVTEVRSFKTVQKDPFIQKEIIDCITKEVFKDHGLSVSLIAMIPKGSIPKTTSGKIQRKKMKDFFSDSNNTKRILWHTPIESDHSSEDKTDDEYVDNKDSATSLSDEKIFKWIQKYLKTNHHIDFDEQDLSRNLTTLGLDSVTIVDFANELESYTGVEISIQTISDNLTLSSLIGYILNESNKQTLEDADKSTFHGSFSEFPQYLDFKKTEDSILSMVKRNPFTLTFSGSSKDTIKFNDKEYINFASYNYLGLAADKRVIDYTSQVMTEYGTSVSASRIASGDRDIIRKLEKSIADLLRVPDSIVFSAGYHTIMSTIPHLYGKGDLILYDEQSHNSTILATLSSNANFLKFRHNDTKHISEILSSVRHQYANVLIVIEGMYGMDGIIPPLPDFIEVKNRFNAFLMIDEAHSIGTIGPNGSGITGYHNVDPSDVDIHMGTLSKALAGCGGYIAGSKDLTDILRYTSPGFVYSAGITPQNAAASLKAIELIKQESELLSKLKDNSDFFLNKLKKFNIDTGLSKDSPIVPAILKDTQLAIKVSNELFDRGIYVVPILAPSVPKGTERLRFFISSMHTKEQLARTAEELHKVLVKFGYFESELKSEVA